MIPKKEEIDFVCPECFKSYKFYLNMIDEERWKSIAECPNCGHPSNWYSYDEYVKLNNK